MMFNTAGVILGFLLFGLLGGGFLTIFILEISPYKVKEKHVTTVFIICIVVMGIFGSLYFSGWVDQVMEEKMLKNQFCLEHGYDEYDSFECRRFVEETRTFEDRNVCLRNDVVGWC